MGSHHIQRSHNRQPSWVVCLCVLLAVLFFYNPFVALTSSAGELAYHSLARNRATVGASELQQFSPQKSLHVVPELFFLSFADSVFRPLQHTWRSAHFAQPSIVPLAKVPSNLWFRPPPVA